MKNIIILLFLTSTPSFAVDAYNGKEYKVRQTLQNVHITGTGTASLDVSGGANVDGQMTIKGSATIVGNGSIGGSSFSVGTSTLVVAGGKVGIGASPAFGDLYVSGTNQLVDASVGNIMVVTNDAAAINKGGTIVFGATSDVANRATAVIGGRKEAAGADYSSYLNFGTRANGGPMVEKMRITSTGNVGIGTTAPTGKLHLSSGAFVLDGAGSYFNIAVSSTITTATDPGTTGDVRRDADYIYVCTAPNTWKRAAIATWP